LPPCFEYEQHDGEETIYLGLNTSCYGAPNPSNDGSEGEGMST